MYGLEGILGNLVTSVATPAIGGVVGDIAGSAVEDATQNEFLKQLSQTTMGVLAGAGVGAGLGALTGGKAGAIGGALTGGVGGGVGGYNAPEIANMFGFGSTPQQSVEASQGGQTAPAPQSSPMPPMSQAQRIQNDPFLAAIQPKQTAAQMNAVSSPIQGIQSSSIQDIVAPTPAPQATSAPHTPEYKGYMDFLKKNYEPLAGGFYLGSAYGANQATNEQAKNYREQLALADALEAKRAREFARSVYAPKYADGGAVNLGLPATNVTPNINVHIPEWAQNQIEREGGLAALQPGLKQGMAAGGDVNDRISQHQSIIDSKTAQAVQQQEAAEGRSLSGSEKKDIYDGVRTRVLNKAELGLGYIAPSAGLGSHISGLRRKAAGGYINLQPMGEQEYPQALIPRAQPYAAASPQRREVIGGFNRGGLIDGAGDGMSDSIPAHIEGQEPVKVADGEYLIPKDIAAKYGPEKLKHMMTKVRAAAHARKGKQIIQDAAKRALISSLSGVRA